MTPTEYLTKILIELSASLLISSFDVMERWAEPDQGYIRVRVRLTNGDFLELAEYFVMSGKKCVTVRYRYQWMDQVQQQLRRRWDNVEHHPGLPGFPYHVHLSDGRIEPSKALGILDVLGLVAEEM